MRHTEFKNGIWDDFLNKRLMVIKVAPDKEYIVEWGCASYIDSLIDKINDRQRKINDLNWSIEALKDRLEYYAPGDYVLEKYKEKGYAF